MSVLWGISMAPAVPAFHSQNEKGKTIINEYEYSEYSELNQNA